MVVRWSRAAELQLKRAFLYIRKDSYQNAWKVRYDIVAMTESLSINPERFPADKLKMNNDGTYRAFELHRYRVSFVILKEVILIVRMRHTAMSPLLY
ncbi:MAG: type II toxin-antitoxin system RelE/ParE family toxin [Bacteroidota bacterium]